MPSGSVREERANGRVGAREFRASLAFGLGGPRAPEAPPWIEKDWKRFLTDHRIATRPRASYHT